MDTHRASSTTKSRKKKLQIILKVANYNDNTQVKTIERQKIANRIETNMNRRINTLIWSSSVVNGRLRCGTFIHTLTLYGFGDCRHKWQSYWSSYSYSKCLEMGWSCIDKRISLNASRQALTNVINLKVNVTWESLESCNVNFFVASSHSRWCGSA